MSCILDNHRGPVLWLHVRYWRHTLHLSDYALSCTVYCTIFVCYCTNQKFVLKKVTIKVHNESNGIQYTQSRHFLTWHVAKILGRHRATIQNCKATSTSLFTNKKTKSTLPRGLLCPNHPVTWVLSYFRQL